MEGSGAQFVSPTGYVELDNQTYSIDSKATRSREYVNPKEDLAFYFQTYLAPKYGLENINVNNVASFMKELEMNWTKLTPELKDNVLNILVDNILVADNSYDFRTRLLAKLNISPQSEKSSSAPLPSSSSSSSSNDFFSKSTFGGNTKDYIYIIVAILILGLLFYLLKNNGKSGFPKMI